MQHTRRGLLTTMGGVVALGTLAGCAGTATPAEDAPSDGPVARGSFFVFNDVAAAVGGDVATAELVVPVGQHGHGWEPGPRVREAVVDADLFVHGMTGFQPWVDRMAADLSADGENVSTVDVSAGIDLLEAGHGDDHEDGYDDEHGDDHDEDHEDSHSEDDHDETTTDHATENAESDDHDHDGNVDPHFWLDPVRLGTAVENVRQGFAAIDEANADVYAANADTFSRELADVDARIQAVVDDGSRDTVLVAGHDSFGYLADRYGLRMESLTSASPDDRPTPRDIERARTLVTEHGLRYICADPLESQQAADQLVAETDAEAVLPLTAMPGLTREWEAEGWGYVDVVENVNLPTLERVLGA